MNLLRRVTKHRNAQTSGNIILPGDAAQPFGVGSANVFGMQNGSGAAQSVVGSGKGLGDIFGNYDLDKVAAGFNIPAKE